MNKKDIAENKKKETVKTVRNDTQAYFIKFNPTARAPQHALEFVPVTCDGKDYLGPIIDKKKFYEEEHRILGTDMTEENTDTIGRSDYVILTGVLKSYPFTPKKGDRYPTYFYEDGRAAWGEVFIRPFVMEGLRGESDLVISTPNDLLSMERMVDQIMELQNGRRFDCYKKLLLANGIVSKDSSDEELTKMAEEEKILIKKPWQLKALRTDFDDKSKERIDMLTTRIDAMDDKETLALQQDVKNMKFLFFKTADISQQMEFIANHVRNKNHVPEGKPLPSIGNGTVDKIIGFYNATVYGKRRTTKTDNRDRRELSAENAETNDAVQKDKKFHFKRSSALTDNQNKLAYAIEKWAFDNDKRNKKGYLLSYNRNAENPVASFNLFVRQAKECGFPFEKMNGMEK